jgi:AcrR family transcriptional regulator
VSSRDVLEEAATELFLERGYTGTSIDDIATRAGVSRATFFNYFPAKVDVLLVGVDRALDALERELSLGAALSTALTTVATHATRSDIPLLVNQADTMGAAHEVDAALATRMVRLNHIVGLRIAESTWRWAIAGAIATGASRWARGGAEDGSLIETIRDELQSLSRADEAFLQGIVP